MEAVGRAVVGGVGMAVLPARARAVTVQVVVLVVAMVVAVVGAMALAGAAAGVAIGIRAPSVRASASSPS
jgi:hypothetical protein